MNWPLLEHYVNNETPPVHSDHHATTKSLCVLDTWRGNSPLCKVNVCGTYLLREVERASSGLQITGTFTAANKLHRLDV